MKRKKIGGKPIVYICLSAALVLIIRYFDVIASWIGKLWGVSVPLIMGLAIAYVLNLVLVRVENRLSRCFHGRFRENGGRAVSIVISILLILAVFVLVGWLVLPEVAKAFRLIAASMPGVVDGAAAWLENTQLENVNMDGIIQTLEGIDWDSLMQKAAAAAKAGIGNVLNSTISVLGTLVGGIVNFFIGLVFAIYILSGKEKLKEQGKKVLRAYLKPATVERIARVYHTANDTFSSFIIGQCTEAVILGSLCTVGMMIFRLPYAPMTGAFIGVTALIPIVGAYLGAAVGAFMIFTVDPFKALLFLIFIVVLQQLEGNLIYPRVVGSSIGLPGIWVLAAVTVGGGLLGVGGMLLGVPVAATLYKLLRRDVNERIAKKENQ